ncbi:hypothetical protein [Chitinophaga sp. S165]|uniref:DUF7151 family protein n=1 Tax=Chitinophaga sp. S165 TaxID=2135462 RepID=UPI000D71A8C4|nr:hypothetical protein [Chitinophaga sp. S165]PWV51959.1 hypothetical protein C7475_103569 [Chitinophaga sp. S165]
MKELFIRKRLLITLFVAAALSTSCEKDKEQGPNGLQSLVDIEQNAPGEKCPNGGITVKNGIDKNRNNILDGEEIQDTKYVCNGSNANTDKQVVLSAYLGGNLSFNDPNGTILPAFPSFSKSDYQNVDSIIFMAVALTSGSPIPAKVELYDMTNSKAIENSSIIAPERYPGILRRTGNLYTQLPSDKVDMGLKIGPDSAGENANASVGMAYLIIYKK